MAIQENYVSYYTFTHFDSKTCIYSLILVYLQQIMFTFELFYVQKVFVCICPVFYSIVIDIGGTQILFRDLPKFSNIGKIFRSSCSAPKTVLSREI